MQDKIIHDSTPCVKTKALPADQLKVGDVVLSSHHRLGLYVVVESVKQDPREGYINYQRIIFSDGSGWSFIPGGHYAETMFDVLTVSA